MSIINDEGEKLPQNVVVLSEIIIDWFGRIVTRLYRAQTSAVEYIIMITIVLKHQSII